MLLIVCNNSHTNTSWFILIVYIHTETYPTQASSDKKNWKNLLETCKCKSICKNWYFQCQKIDPTGSDFAFCVGCCFLLLTVPTFNTTHYPNNLRVFLWIQCLYTQSTQVNKAPLYLRDTKLFFLKHQKDFLIGKQFYN